MRARRGSSSTQEDAYVASALTDFTGGIDADLFSLDDQTVPDPGNRPDKALALAGTMLDEAHILNGDVILVSAGAGLDGTAAIRAARTLAAAGHRVFTMDATIDKSAVDNRRAAALAAVASAGNGFAVSVLQPDRLLDTLSNDAIHHTGGSVINAARLAGSRARSAGLGPRCRCCSASASR